MHDPWAPDRNDWRSNHGPKKDRLHAHGGGTRKRPPPGTAPSSSSAFYTPDSIEKQPVPSGRQHVVQHPSGHETSALPDASGEQSA
jgi:hypothetical protein